MNRYVYTLYDSELGEFSPLQSHPTDDIFVTNLLINLYESSCSVKDFPQYGSPVCIDYQNHSVTPNDAFLSRFVPFRVGIWDDETGVLEPVRSTSVYDLMEERLSQLVDVLITKYRESEGGDENAR